MMKDLTVLLETVLRLDKKGLESLPEIICCVLWHGPVMEVLTYLHYMYISNKKYVLKT